jgi:hypothetical protein
VAALNSDRRWWKWPTSTGASNGDVPASAARGGWAIGSKRGAYGVVIDIFPNSS